jgi:hypothetical protein
MNKKREWAADAFDKARLGVYIYESKATMIDKYSRVSVMILGPIFYFSILPHH